MKTGGVSKRVTRSKSKDPPEEENDDVVIVDSHPAGTLATQLPMDKVPRSLPATSTASKSASKSSEKATGEKKPARARRMRDPPSLKPDPVEKSDKPDKKKKKSDEKLVARKSEKDVTAKVVASTKISKSEASQLPAPSTTSEAVSAISGTGTQTVSITSTHVTAGIQKQFGDTAKKRQSTVSPVEKKTGNIPSSRSAFVIPTPSTSTGLVSGSAAELMSSIDPSTSRDLMPRRNAPREVENQNVASSSCYQLNPDKQCVRVSSRSRDASGYAGFNRDRSPSLTRPSGSRQVPPVLSPSPERGRSRSRSDYQPSIRSTSIPVHRTYAMLPRAWIAPEEPDFDLDLVTPKHHGK